jgi:type II secretory pathway pseudopilin PulG
MGKNELGQSLLEIIFAISITGILLAGFVSAIVYFSRTGQVAESSSRATQLAQEKIEELRSQKISSQYEFWQNMETYATATPTPESLMDGKYNRSLEVSYSVPDGTNRRAEVEVIVDWIEAGVSGGSNKEVRVKSYFSEY